MDNYERKWILNSQGHADGRRSSHDAGGQPINEEARNGKKE
jgi:hypothetical protein